jgi:hypothetical protein
MLKPTHRLSKNLNMQTCENDMFVCRIQTHAWGFSIFFLLRHEYFSDPECYSHPNESDFKMHECEFYMQCMIFIRMSLISTRKVWFLHAERDFDTH